MALVRKMAVVHKDRLIQHDGNGSRPPPLPLRLWSLHTTVVLATAEAADGNTKIFITWLSSARLIFGQTLLRFVFSKFGNYILYRSVITYEESLEFGSKTKLHKNNFSLTI